MASLPFYIMEVILDKGSMRALSCDTRIDALKLLEKRRMTLSEISRALDKSKSTMSKHLNKLLDANLVVKRENGNKWIYYELSQEGREITSKRERREKGSFVLLLSTVISVILSASFLYCYLQSVKGEVFRIASFGGSPDVSIYLSAGFLAFGLISILLSLRMKMRISLNMTDIRSRS